MIVAMIKMESTFREMKQVIGAFGYHFWSKSMPKLNRYRQKGTPDPLEKVVNEQDQLRIRQTLRTIEGFVMCHCMAMGLLQLIALRFPSRISLLSFRYLRTPAKTVVSKATVAVYLRKFIFRGFDLLPQLPIINLFVPSRLPLSLTLSYLSLNSRELFTVQLLKHRIKTLTWNPIFPYIAAECYQRHQFQTYPQAYKIASQFIRDYNHTHIHGSIYDLSPYDYITAVQQGSVKPKQITVKNVPF